MAKPTPSTISVVVIECRGPTGIHVHDTTILRVTKVDIDAGVMIELGAGPSVAIVFRGQHDAVATTGVHHDVEAVAAGVLHEVGVLARAVGGGIIAAEVFDGHKVTPGLAAIQRTDVVEGVGLAIGSHFAIGGHEDVDILVLGAVAHHSREVRVVSSFHNEGRSQITVRQVVLVFDDVDFAGTGFWVT